MYIKYKYIYIIHIDIIFVVKLAFLNKQYRMGMYVLRKIK